jgi:pilus assembly protein Flp/PilA
MPVLKSLKSLLADDSGATAIEYGLLAAFLAVFLIASLSALGTRMAGEYNEISSALK